MTGTERIIDDIKGLIKPTVKNNREAISERMQPFNVGNLTPVGFQNVLNEWYDAGRYGDVVHVLDVPFIPENGPEFAQEFFATHGAEGESLLKARERALAKADAQPDAEPQPITEMINETYIAPVVAIMMAVLLAWILSK